MARTLSSALRDPQPPGPTRPLTAGMRARPRSGPRHTEDKADQVMCMARWAQGNSQSLARLVSDTDGQWRWPRPERRAERRHMSHTSFFSSLLFLKLKSYFQGAVCFLAPTGPQWALPVRQTIEGPVTPSELPTWAGLPRHWASFTGGGSHQSSPRPRGSELGAGPSQKPPRALEAGCV